METKTSDKEKCFHCLKQIREDDIYTVLENKLLLHNKCYIWYNESDKINTNIIICFCIVVLIIGLTVISSMIL